MKTIAEVYRTRAGKYRFRIKARNGEVISSGQAYTRRDSAVRGARRACPGALVVVVKS